MEECQPGMIFGADGCVEKTSDSCVEEVFIEETQNNDLKGLVIPNFDPNELCAGINLAFVPHPNDCTSFILCQNQVGEVRQCPSAIPIFDSSRLICVAGNIVKIIEEL